MTARGDVDGGGTEVLADRFQAGVVAGQQRLVVVGGLRGVGEFDRQPHLGQRRPVQLRTDRGALVVDPVAERYVEVAQHLVAVLLLGGHGHPHRAHARLEPLAVPLLQPVAPLVEHGQTHQVEPHGDRPDPFDLQQPAGGVPGPRAARVEPHVGGRHGGCSSPSGRVDRFPHPVGRIGPTTEPIPVVFPGPLALTGEPGRARRAADPTRRRLTPSARRARRRRARHRATGPGRAAPRSPPRCRTRT